MTKNELQKLLDQSAEKIVVNYQNPEYLAKKISEITDKNGNISSAALTVYAISESISYSKQMIYDALTQIIPFED